MNDEAERAKVAQACRILAMEGLLSDVLGHVSVRASERRMLIRCRGPREHGLAYSTADDILATGFDGTPAEPAGEYRTPNELPIHGATLAARQDVGAVVHAHPRAVLLCGIAGLPLRPIVGAYNIPAMRMAADGIPVYPRSVLIRTPELAADMLAVLADRPACLLRGHGFTVVGDTLEQAVVRALNLNELAEVTLAAAQAGGVPDPIDAADIAELPDLGSAFNDLAVWRYYSEKEATMRAAPAR